MVCVLGCLALLFFSFFFAWERSASVLACAWLKMRCGSCGDRRSSAGHHDYGVRTGFSLASMESRVWTLAELADLKQRGQRLLMAVDGLVFDVSSAPGFYGPGKAYHQLVGGDASRALAKTSLAVADLSSRKLSDLSQDEQTTLKQWVAKLRQKYPVVGTLQSSSRL